jgi:hypothetical protein
MQALEFWKAVTLDRVNFLESLISLLDEHGVQYCLIGGQAVNAYVEPLVSLDLDLVVATGQLDRVKELLDSRFTVRRFPDSLNVSVDQSDLRVQIRTDARYQEFPQRASRREVLGLTFGCRALAGDLSRFAFPHPAGDSGSPPLAR